MSVSNVELAATTKLRLDAESRLRGGAAPSTHGWTLGVNTLDLLHKLASDPDRAVDALKLLHELQVHQVELDLQHEHMEITQQDLAEELARYRALYEHAPVALLTVSAGRDVLDGNAAACRLFGTTAGELRGSSLDALLGHGSGASVGLLLASLRPGGPGAKCDVEFGAAHGAGRAHVRASLAAGGGPFLVALVETTDRGVPGRPA